MWERLSYPSPQPRSTDRGLFAILFAFLFWCPATTAAAETSRLEFVTEYIRELGANEEMRALAAREIAEPTDKYAAMIRGSTRIVLELTAQIGMLKGINLTKPFDDLPEILQNSTITRS